MTDRVLIDALVCLFRAEGAAANEAHANETRRCLEMTPPDAAGASAGRRRLRKAYEQMFEPEGVKLARRAADAEAWQRHRAQYQERRASFIADRQARGLPAEPTTGKPEVPVYIHRPPEVDFWAGLEETQDNVAVVLAAQAAANARQNDDHLGGLPLGHSRIGGVPDLPPDVQWPTPDGKKIPFIAQLKLADFPAVHRLLPAAGHLFVFVLSDNDYSHFPPPTVVFLYRGAAESLMRARRPVEDDEVFLDAAEDGVYDCLPATATMAREIEDAEEDAALGHFFGEMQDYYGTPGETAGHALADGDDWIVLMEVGSVGSMQWSDCGSLYLLIRREALARLDFCHVIAAVCSS